MDITFATVPNSQQLNADDFLLGEQTFTTKAVERGNDDQKLFIHLAEVEGRTFRPNTTMSRMLGTGWGRESDDWIGRRLTLYRDPDVNFGPTKTGGIRISGMSHIDKPVTVAQRSKGKGKHYTAQPLADAHAIDITAYTPALEQATNVDQLKNAFFAAPPAVQKDPRFIAAKDKRKDELAAQGQEAGA